MHPKQREHRRRDDVSRLVVTVETDEEFGETVRNELGALEGGDAESVDGTPILSFSSYDELCSVFTPRTLELVETIRREQPTSINGAARAVDRDVKNVHTQLTRLERLGVVHFQQDGRSKRPIVWFDELDIRLSMDGTGEGKIGRASAD